MRERALGFLVFLAVCLWRATLRIRLVGVEHRQRLEFLDKPVLHAIWHQRMVLGILKHPFSGCVTMASQSRDGEIVSTFLRLWGFRVERGSSSRGGAAALMGMLQEIGRGSRRWAALTPDGPRGPARHCKAGIVKMAEELEAPVLPVGTSASRARFLSSWDRYMVPLPFARCAVVMGEPITRGAGETEAAFLARLDAAIDTATDEADRICGQTRAPRERTRGGDTEGRA